jgi:uncharacterized protein (TIGR00725 family)
MNNLKHMRKNIIGVIGGSVCSEEEYKIAEKVGQLIAKNDGILICGGMGGIMEAACKGASSVNGITIGILPSDNIKEANPYVLIPVATGMGIGRNIIIVRTANVLIAINGKYGTLSEIAFAQQMNKRVIALNPWLKVPGLDIVNTPEEAVEKAFHVLGNY